MTRAALADADALALILDEHQAASAEETTTPFAAAPYSSDAPRADETPERRRAADRLRRRRRTKGRLRERRGRGRGDAAVTTVTTAGADAAQLARECVKRAGEFSVFIAVEADQRPPELRFDRAAGGPTADQPGNPRRRRPDAAAAEGSGEGPSGSGDEEPGANPLESFEAFGSWFNKMVETAADQFTGNNDDDGSSDDDGEDLSDGGDAAAGMVKSSGPKSPEKKPAAKREKRDSESERKERERKEREAEALRRYKPKRPRDAANGLAARCGVRAGRILSVATMHLVPPPGGFARTAGGAAEAQPAATTTRMPNRTGTVRNRSSGREGKGRPRRKRRSASATRRSARGPCPSSTAR